MFFPNVSKNTLIIKPYLLVYSHERAKRERAERKRTERKRTERKRTERAERERTERERTMACQSLLNLDLLIL